LYIAGVFITFLSQLLKPFLTYFITNARFLGFFADILLVKLIYK